MTTYYVLKLGDVSQLERNEGYGLSNLDHAAEEGTEEFLRAHPGTHYVTYAGWDFFAYVAFDGAQFVVDVWRHREPVEQMLVYEFDDIIPTVSNTYGWG